MLKGISWSVSFEYVVESFHIVELALRSTLPTVVLLVKNLVLLDEIWNRRLTRCAPPTPTGFVRLGSVVAADAAAAAPAAKDGGAAAERSLNSAEARPWSTPLDNGGDDDCWLLLLESFVRRLLTHPLLSICKRNSTLQDLLVRRDWPTLGWLNPQRLLPRHCRRAVRGDELWYILHPPLW